MQTIDTAARRRTETIIHSRRVSTLFESASRSFRAMVGRNTGSLDSAASHEPDAAADPVLSDPTPRERLTRRIQSFNPSAADAWLATFSDAAIKLYAEHLETAAGRRGAAARWIRPRDTPGVVGVACNVN